MSGERDRGISAEESREIDRRALEEFGTPGLLLMEHAAIGASTLVLDFIAQLGLDRRALVSILAGPGNNGGDALAVARHLHLAGHAARVFEIIGPPRADSDAGVQRRMVEALGIEIVSPAGPIAAATLDGDLIVDGIFGTGLSRAPEGPARDVIAAANGAEAETIALDVPSGLDATTGEPLGETIRARATVTFAAVKSGLLAQAARNHAGELFVTPIGAPAELLPSGAPLFPPRPRPVRR